ncbi:FCD domain-containing protein, partial [Salinivibrio kushneri]
QSLVLLAISRGSESQKKQLGEYVTELAALAAEENPDLDRLGELDRALNLLIAAMSGNPIFEWVMHAIQQGFSSHDYALYQAADYRRQTVENWQQTVNHIIAAEPFKAQATISHHYRLLQQCIDAQASS